MLKKFEAKTEPIVLDALTTATTLHAAIFAEYCAIFLDDTAVFKTAFDVFTTPRNFVPLAPLPPMRPDIAPMPVDSTKSSGFSLKTDAFLV